MPLTELTEFATVEFAAVKSRSDERMSRQRINRLKSVLLAVATLVPVPTIAAHPVLGNPNIGSPNIGSSMVPITDFPTSGLQDRYGECCPVDWDTIHSGASACGFNVTGGTHDSAPTYRLASLSRSDFLPAAPKQEVKAETTTVAEIEDAAEIDTVAARQDVSIPTAIMAVTSVRVQQFVEPFAVVGPRLTPTGESLAQFLDWCNHVANNPPARSTTDRSAIVVDSPSPVESVISIDRLLDSLATEEPVDADENYVVIRNYVERANSDIEQPSISVEKIDPLIGGSAIVATIGSGPFPGDLNPGDLHPGDLSDNNFSVGDLTARDVTIRNRYQAGQVRLWSVLPTVTRPFCIRHSFDHLDLNHFNMTETLKAHRIDAGSDDLVIIGDIESMLADARSSLPKSNELVSHRAQADAIVEAVSTTVTLLENVRTWAASQDLTAKRQAFSEASRILARASTNNLVSDLTLQDLGRGITEWTFAGQEIASQAAAAVAKKMPSHQEPAAIEKAEAKLASAPNGLDLQ